MERIKRRLSLQQIWEKFLNYYFWKNDEARVQGKSRRGSAMAIGNRTAAHAPDPVPRSLGESGRWGPATKRWRVVRVTLPTAQPDSWTRIAELGKGWAG